MLTTMSKENLRERYWELMDARDEILKESAPIRAKYNALRDDMLPLETQAKKLRDAFIKVERPVLPAIDQERAMIQKILGSGLGERPVEVENGTG